MKVPSIFIQRVVGEPGDRVRFADAKLYVNGQETEILDSSGPVRYILPEHARPTYAGAEEFLIPDGHYFTAGDNSGNTSTAVSGDRCL